MRGRHGWPLYRTLDLPDPAGFTEASAGPVFADAADFGELLDRLEALAENRYGETGLTTLQDGKGGTYHALS